MSKSTVRCLVIVNPAAGTVTDAIVEQITLRCARWNASAHVVRTFGRGDATRLARAARTKPGDGHFLIIVSVGGDGTTREVVEGLVGDGRPVPDRIALFVVPAGTGNSNYRALWGDMPWPDALDEALRAPVALLRRLDLARLAEHDRLVVLGAGAGLTADVLNLAPAGIRGRDKLRAGMERAAQRFRPFPGRITVDGTTLYEGPTVFANVGGGRHRAWRYLILPHSVLDDGFLDVCVVGQGTPVADVPALLQGGRHLAEPGVRYGRGRRVVIEHTGGTPLCFEHDGELVTDAGPRVTLDVVPAVLPVLCQPRRPGAPARPPSAIRS